MAIDAGAGPWFSRFGGVWSTKASSRNKKQWKPDPIIKFPPAHADQFPPLFPICPYLCQDHLSPPESVSAPKKMFKRVEKKLARRKKEEELGITEEIKGAIGLNDIDSDDSSSDEGEASSSSSTPKISSKRKLSLDDDELDASSDPGSERQVSGVSDDSEGGDSDDDEPGVQMTVEEALHNPLYIVSIQPDIRGCIVCPNKVLKNDVMTSVHTRSQVRRVPTFPSCYGDLMTFISLLFGRLISDGYPSSRRRPDLPNQMTTRRMSCPSFSHQLHNDRHHPPMIPLHRRTVRPSG